MVCRCRMNIDILRQGGFDVHQAEVRFLFHLVISLLCLTTVILLPVRHHRDPPAAAHLGSRWSTPPRTVQRSTNPPVILCRYGTLSVRWVLCGPTQFPICFGHAQQACEQLRTDDRYEIFIMAGHANYDGKEKDALFHSPGLGLVPDTTAHSTTGKSGRCHWC